MSSNDSPPLTPVVTPTVTSSLPSDGCYDGFSPALVHILREVFDIRDTDPVPVLVTALHQAGIRDMFNFIDTTRQLEFQAHFIE